MLDLEPRRGGESSRGNRKLFECLITCAVKKHGVHFSCYLLDLVMAFCAGLKDLSKINKELEKKSPNVVGIWEVKKGVFSSFCAQVSTEVIKSFS